MMLLNHCLKKMDGLIFVTAILFFTLSLWFVTYYGNPLTDEGFPLAVAYRFVLGQKPFVDDLSPYISIGLLLYPIIKLSILVHHGTDRLILFVRHLFIIVTLCFGIYTYLMTKKYLYPPLAFLIGAMIAFYHPFQIHNFHYDTLALLTWTILLLQLVKYSIQDKISKIESILFGFCAVGLCFSYPTLIFILAPVCIFSSFHFRNPKLFLVMNGLVLIGCIAIMTWLIFIYFDVTLSNIMNALNYWESDFLEQGGLNKFFKILSELCQNYEKYVINSFLLVFAMFLLRKRMWGTPIFLAVLLILPLYYINFRLPGYWAAFYFFNCIGLVGALIYLFFLRSDKIATKFFCFMWTPAFCAGLLTCMSSATFACCFNVGFFPAVIASLIFIYQTMLSHCKAHGFNDINSYFLTRVILIYILTMTAFFQMQYVYGSNYFGLDAFIKVEKCKERGPFQDIYFNDTWTTILRYLSQDIKHLDNDSSKFIYFGPFSGGYLLIKQLKPGDYNLYNSYIWNTKQLRMPCYTLILKEIFLPKKTVDNNLVNSPYIKFRTNSYYDILYAS